MRIVSWLVERQPFEQRPGPKEHLPLLLVEASSHRFAEPSLASLAVVLNSSTSFLSERNPDLSPVLMVGIADHELPILEVAKESSKVRGVLSLHLRLGRRCSIPAQAVDCSEKHKLRHRKIAAFGLATHAAYECHEL